MDREINNEINIKPNERDNDINEFMEELKNALEDPKNKISIDKSFYDELYSEIELAKSHQDKLEDIIKESMLDYSYDTEFVYVNYDEKTRKYYMDIYDGDVTKVNVTKKEIEDSNIKVGAFYFVLNDGEYLEEEEYIKEDIKSEIEYKLNNLEKDDNRRKNGN